MQFCITGSGTPDSRYIASPEFLATVSYLATFLEFPILTYGACCIIFKTPKKMGSVKWMMFNLHFWSSMSDLVISCIGIPFILLPAPAGYGLGFVDAPRLMTYCMATLLADMSIPLVCIAIATTILAIPTLKFCALIFINLATLKKRIHSEKAMEAHKNFAIALTIQSAFFSSVVLAPVLVILWMSSRPSSQQFRVHNIISSRCRFHYHDDISTQAILGIYTFQHLLLF
ncbi:Protein CBG01166 [Caenorhabditis briggsae]|uniref:Protein CBG01166 n=1 Tax=Caenorhabditis briggsae TaxID=6238 RepID=A8WPQ7_CAEBR|nr:Protein CBG01166 [Caenorhabditis briggsae]CAP22464.2 Protein CBG01166 [Caenorhabditis briggsae]